MATHTPHLFHTNIHAPASAGAAQAPAASSTQVAPVLTTTNERTTSWGRRFLAITRIAFGWSFLWAFLDKTFGLGFSTPSENAWISGGDPTAGYLGGNEGTFSELFNSLAGQWWVSPLFMLGLLGIGIALISGAGMRIAGISGAALYLMMWLAAFPIVTNPFLDSHLSGAIIVAMLALTYAGDTWGLGRWWKNTAVVQRFPALR